MSDFDDFIGDTGAYWQAPDIILTDIITTMVNMMGMPVGVTLFVKGTILSGMLVSEEQYLENLSQTFRAIANLTFETDGDEEAEDEVNEVFDFTRLAENNYAAFRQKYDEADEHDDHLGDEDDEVFDEDEFDPLSDTFIRPVRYLHLKDAMILYPNGTIAFKNALYPVIRLRLNAIDGWLLGQALDPSSLDDGVIPRPMVH